MTQHQVRELLLAMVVMWTPQNTVQGKVHECEKLIRYLQVFCG